MAAHIIAFPTASSLSRTPAPAAGLRASVLAMWQARSTRRLLAEMDPHMLADVGMGRGEALMESARPFWDLDPRR